MSQDIVHRVVINAPATRVFSALVDGDQFAAWSGAPAEGHPEPGSAFFAFGGAVVGRVIEAVPAERLVQAWRLTAWPAGLYSLVRFALQEVPGGTEISFSHSGFPAEERDHLDKGWHARYWEPLRNHLRA